MNFKVWNKFLLYENVSRSVNLPAGRQVKKVDDPVATLNKKNTGEGYLT